MTKQSLKLIAFTGCAAGLVSTYIVAAGLIDGKGVITSELLRYLYIILFLTCPLILLVNLFKPVFNTSVFAKPISASVVVAMVVVNILAFQSLVFLGLAGDGEFWRLYAKHFVLLQAINLFYLWTCALGAIGQENVHPVFRGILTNPLGAVGYLIGYKLTKLSGKNQRKRKG